MQVNSSQSRHSALSEINVTPLVDVMLVLLIIFMVTAPMMQQGIDVDLPETAASGVETSNEPFILTIDKNEKIIISGTKDKNRIDITLKNLRPKLNAIFSTRKNKQIYLQADKAVSYGFVAETMAEIRAAGISNIGLVTLPKASQ
ncbi:MAG: protein TolR [Proteobacteria bacterium SG_bin7]|nr:MAG: protein TolR [Proteobacteria bacterium SG_bin7]